MIQTGTVFRQTMHHLRHWVESSCPGLARLYRRLRDAWQIARARSYRSRYGWRLHGDVSHALGQPRAEDLRIEEIAFFLDRLQECQAVVDVGANFGLLSLLAAREGRSVLAVEPEPRNYRALRRNLRINGMANIETRAVALSNRTGQAVLYGAGEMASLREQWGSARVNYGRTVPTTTLDELLHDRFAGQRLLIKIDAEGHESVILEGAAKTLLRRPSPLWLVECGLTENFAGPNPGFQEFFARFFSAGYRAFTADRHRREITSHDIARWVRQGHRDFGDINFEFS